MAICPPFTALSRVSPAKAYVVQPSAGRLPPCGVAVHVPQEDGPRGLEFLPDEAKPEHPAPHRVLFVVRLLGLGACVAHFVSQFAHPEAKLDESLDFAAVDAAALSVVGVGKLEEAEFDGSVPVEEAVKIQQVMCSYT